MSPDDFAKRSMGHFGKSPKTPEIRIAADTIDHGAAELFHFVFSCPQNEAVKRVEIGVAAGFSNKTILSASKRTEAVNYTPAMFPIFAFRIQRNTLDTLSMTNSKTTGLVRSSETTTALMVDA
jgi:hypothetical protein